MLTQGPAKRVTIFVNEDSRHHLTPLHDAIMNYLLHKGVAGATVTRGWSGFGSHQTMHTPKVEALAEHLPVRIEFVESPAKVDEVLPTLYEMVADGLIEVQDTVVIRATPPAEAPIPEPAPAHEEERGPALLLRVFIGEADQWHGEPLHEAIVKQLRMMGIAGATVHRGIMGYGAKGHEHKRSFFHPMRDLPIIISVIDKRERIIQAAEVIESMLEDGLLVTSEVEMVRLVRSKGPQS